MAQDLFYNAKSLCNIHIYFLKTTVWQMVTAFNTYDYSPSVYTIA